MQPEIPGKPRTTSQKPKTDAPSQDSHAISPQRADDDFTLLVTRGLVIKDSLRYRLSRSVTPIIVVQPHSHHLLGFDSKERIANETRTNRSPLYLTTAPGAHQHVKASSFPDRIK